MTGSTATVYEIEVPATRDQTKVAKLPFRISGEDFVMTAPKLSAAAPMLAMLEREGEDITMNEGLELSRALWGLIDYVETAPPEPLEIDNPDWFEGAPDDVPRVIVNPNAGRLRGRARILQRLQSPKDAMDIHHLAPVLRVAVEAMFNGRPTGSLAASSPAPASDGHVSAEASPESQDETSTS